MMHHPARNLLKLTIAIAVVIAVTALGVLVTARQSPEPLTGNWVVRTQNNDGTFARLI